MVPSVAVVTVRVSSAYLLGSLRHQGRLPRSSIVIRILNPGNRWGFVLSP